jgi:D-alanyl-D-alanine dipeptidase
MKKWILLVSIFLCNIFLTKAQQLPEGFVYLHNINNSIQSELRYITNNNFIGQPIDGYKKNVVIVSKPTAKALHKIQQHLLKDSLSLKIFDTYRPQQAVDHFVKWAKNLNDTIMKTQYYPEVKKSQLFKKGYIASKSGHTRGSTVDLTIVDLKTGKELDMGSSYDFFGAISHPFSNNINNLQKKNRMLLRKVMLSHNFKPYENEWWHFTLKNEPFPNTYFNFPVE